MHDKVADIALRSTNLPSADAAGLAEALRPASAVTSASTMGAALSTRPTARTTARFRSASSFLAMPTTSSPRSRVCREFGAPLLCRGGGTSLAGQCCNVAVVLDFSKYMGNILEIDPERRIARVQPGVVLDHLRNAAEKHHLTFGPDPASHDRCTIGGMIGNNSCGVHSVMAGKTDDNIEELEVVTYDGTRMRRDGRDLSSRS